MSSSDGHFMLLCGGVGGAKLALGLAHVLDPDSLTIVVNTGDDFQHLGLSISPDLDTVAYTLAGLANPTLGWGRADESWTSMATLELLGGESWFRLGDKDIALHLARNALFAGGYDLAQVTEFLSRKLGVRHRILPMSNDGVSTRIETHDRILAFQEYFVRDRCTAQVRRILFEGIETAKPLPAVMQLLRRSDLQGIILAPSNPFLSLDPILALPGFRDALHMSPVPVIGVSPLIGSQAFKGPTAKIMNELGFHPRPYEVARYYRELLTGFIIDESDAALSARIEDVGVRVKLSNITMSSLESKIELARVALDFVRELGSASTAVKDSKVS